MEITNVHAVYASIAKEFDVTRVALWKGVVMFLESLPSGSTILDLGCGNGKYLGVRKDCEIYGCDACQELVDIAKARYDHANVMVGNGLDLPYDDNMFDAVICVAVLHHVETLENRVKFLREIQRVLKPNGKAYITVWATEARKPNWKSIGNSDFLVPWNGKADRYYHLYTESEIRDVVSNSGLTIDTIDFEFKNWHTRCHVTK